MINTKALTIRFGHSRFWRVKFVPLNFYENYHYNFLNTYIQDFFSQKIFHLVGFVYGHSVIKYYPNFIRAEVFIHDFRLEEFFKTFFKLSKRNAKKRIIFRRRFFRPFFKRFFKTFIVSKFNNRGKRFFHSKFKKFGSYRKKPLDEKYDTNLKFMDTYQRRPNSFKFTAERRNKRFFSGFKHSNFSSRYRNNFINRSSKFKKFGGRRRFKFSRSHIFLKSFFRFFFKVKVLFRKINAFTFFKKDEKKLFKLKKLFFILFKFFNFFTIIYKRFIKVGFIKPFFYFSNFYKFLGNNVFFVYKRFSGYTRYNLFSSYSFLPYSRFFIHNHLSKKLSKRDLLSTKIYRFSDFSINIRNIRFRSYYSHFLKSFKFRNFSQKISKFKRFFKVFFLNYSFSPFFSHFSTYDNYFNTSDNVFNVTCRASSSNVFFTKRKINFKRKNLWSNKKVHKVFKSVDKYTIFRFVKKKRRKSKRTFLPFLARFKMLSYNYFKFFRFKFFKFVCSLFSRSFNTKFFGLPIKLFIRVVPAYRTTVNMFLRYFITRLFYRYMLGDIINPIVRTSMKRFRGFTAVANGRFTRAQIASHKQYKRGSVSFSSVSIPIDYNQICVPLKYGTCNLKLWMRYLFFF